jgi:SPP1 gp7 family putative phage head morphogenesis protein
MNKRQKLVQQQFLDNEEAVIKRLKAVYNQSLKDIKEKTKQFQFEINELQALIDETEDEAEKATLKSMQQSKIYQKQYQDALKKQINSVLDTMQVEEFKTIDEYLKKCYEDGFVGTMYDLEGQGIPMCMPLNQEDMVRAVQTDSKISQGLYTRLGEDVDLLKTRITSEVSRGISTGMSFQQVAKQLEAHSNIGYNNAVRIARTEGHRIQVQSTMDACYKAKDIGADIVKQWDATLDKRTRDSHTKVDGEIRELDKPFSNGLMFPSDPNGGASEVVNCRCALLQRARWALDDKELETLKKRASYYGLDKSKDFNDYKSKYLSIEKEVKD